MASPKPIPDYHTVATHDFGAVSPMTAIHVHYGVSAAATNDAAASYR